jgi:predicted regulator of Ras-like GTPase activity (Roadblock/LC7/MglB family)
MNYGIEDPEQLEKIDRCLQEDLIDKGVQCSLLIDTAGNTISKCLADNCRYDTYALAAVAAGNFATVDSLAKIVGESEFSLLFHKGENVSIHFNKVSEEILLINIFDNNISLGLLRLKAKSVSQKIKLLCRPGG